LKAGASVRPKTGLEEIKGIAGDLDLILVMSVEPGFAGQKFMESAIPKVEALRRIYDGDIEVDGGMNVETAKKVIRAGANVIATASYFFKSEDQKKAVDALKKIVI